MSELEGKGGLESVNEKQDEAVVDVEALEAVLVEEDSVKHTGYQSLTQTVGEEPDLTEVVIDIIDRFDIENHDIGEEKDGDVVVEPTGSTEAESMLQAIRNMLLRRNPYFHVGNTDKDSEDVKRNDSDLHIELNRINRGKEVGLDFTSIQSSPLLLLGGGHCEYFITFQVLVYLDIDDLARLSNTGKFFRDVCSSNILWDQLYHNYFPADFESRLSDDDHSNHDLHEHKDDDEAQEDSLNYMSLQFMNKYFAVREKPSKNVIHSKTDFKLRLKDHNTRITKAKLDVIQRIEERKRRTTLVVYENILDFIHVRTMVPVVFCGTFLSILLYCQLVDGLNIPVWSAALPILCSLVYGMLGFGIVHFIFRRNFSFSSTFHGLWTQMSGPLPFIYREVVGDSYMAYYLVQFMVGLAVFQITLVVLKLMLIVYANRFSWGFVFIPIWIVFALFLLSPCTPMSLTLGVYVFAIVVVWIPFFVLFVCLTYKLDTNPSMRLALILIPFYIIEASAMLGSAVVLLSGVLM